VHGEEVALLLGEQAAQPLPPGHGFLDVILARCSLERCRADEAPGHRVDLDLEALRAAHLVGQLVRDHRPELDDRVVLPALDAPGAHDHPGGVERELRRVEEEDLPEVRVERVDTERACGRTPVLLGDCELQLDAVGATDQLHNARELLIGEPRRGSRVHAAKPDVRGGPLQA
jgi:hypothetical protein